MLALDHYRTRPIAIHGADAGRARFFMLPAPALGLVTDVEAQSLLLDCYHPIVTGPIGTSDGAPRAEGELVRVTCLVCGRAIAVAAWGQSA